LYLEQINALPEHSSATVNYRIDFLSSVNETLTRIAHILEPVATSLNITLDAYGSHSEVENNVVRLAVVPKTNVEPAPLTPSTGPAFELMSGTIKHVFDNPIVAPSAMIGESMGLRRQEQLFGGPRRAPT
jgi:Gly-Xaa carboxypeptidase